MITAGPLFTCQDRMACRITDDRPPKDYAEEDRTDERRQERVDDAHAIPLKTLMEIVEGARWQL